ncbi:MAG: hypothetical protein ABSG15_12855, partial [FCB group bacterium]
LFRIKLYDSLNNPVSFDSMGTIYTKLYAMKIDKDSIIGKELFYRMNSWADSTVYLYMTSRQNGIFGNSVNTYTGLLDSIEEMFKYPANAGDIYISDNGIITVSSINEIVTVPAGTFSCYLYDIKIADEEVIFYISPGSGFIKIEIDYTSRPNGRLVIFELTNLTLK